MRTISQIFSYVGVGIIVVAIDVTCYAVFVAANPDFYLAANGIAKVAAASSGFFLHQRYTFKGVKRHRKSKQVATYILLLTFNALLSSVLILLGIERFKVNEQIAKLLSEGIVVSIAFLGARFIVFAEQSSKQTLTKPEMD